MKFLKVDSLGFWFTRKGDLVIWIWPWDRKKNEGKKWVLRAGGWLAFHELKDIDTFWKEHFEFYEGMRLYDEISNRQNS